MSKDSILLEKAEMQEEESKFSSLWVLVGGVDVEPSGGGSEAYHHETEVVALSCKTYDGP